MTKPKKRQPLGQTIGGVLFGFEQQVLRTMPPPQELVHHARPDDPVPAGDGGFVTIGMPDDESPVQASVLGPPEPCQSEPEPGTDPGADET
jgi:hypothetical protein